jgi:hypothetical protein
MTEAMSVPEDIQAAIEATEKKIKLLINISVDFALYESVSEWIDLKLKYERERLDGLLKRAGILSDKDIKRYNL